MPREEADFLHDQGFSNENRSYKLFTFSRLRGRSEFNRDNQTLTFYNKVHFSLSSVLDDVIKKTANFLMLSHEFLLNGQPIQVDQISYESYPIHKSVIKVKALSPITVYSTFSRRNGQKITHYFNPEDKAFEHLIEENFVRKYEAYTKQSLPGDQLISFSPVRVGHRDKVVTRYKNIWITGWLGTYELKGEPEYLKFLLNAGLGAKNAMGMGMCIPIEESEEKKKRGKNNVVGTNYSCW